jgi:hypothetical protein
MPDLRDGLRGESNSWNFTHVLDSESFPEQLANSR